MLVHAAGAYLLSLINLHHDINHEHGHRLQHISHTLWGIRNSSSGFCQISSRLSTFSSKLFVSIPRVYANAMYPREKSQPSELPYEELTNTENETHPRQSTRSTTVYSLLVSALVASFFFGLPNHCHHALSTHFAPKPVTVEQRVKSILSHTPLIGKFISPSLRLLKRYGSLTLT